MWCEVKETKWHCSYRAGEGGEEERVRGVLSVFCISSSDLIMCSESFIKDLRIWYTFWTHVAEIYWFGNSTIEVLGKP